MESGNGMIILAGQADKPKRVIEALHILNGQDYFELCHAQVILSACLSQKTNQGLQIFINRAT